MSSGVWMGCSQELDRCWVGLLFICNNHSRGINTWWHTHKATHPWQNSRWFPLTVSLFSWDCIAKGPTWDQFPPLPLLLGPLCLTATNIFELFSEPGEEIRNESQREWGKKYRRNGRFDSRPAGVHTVTEAGGLNTRQSLAASIPSLLSPVLSFHFPSTFNH